jgi:hypothetical protein
VVVGEEPVCVAERGRIEEGQSGHGAQDSARAP